jgi:hypothetical protein
MMPHRCAPLALLALSVSAAACGSTAAPVGVTPALTAVNGASAPALFAGDTAFWTGIGFGPDSAAGAVLVPGAGGFLHAEIVEWTDDAVEAVLPADAASGSSYLVAGGDTLGPIDLLIRPRATFLPGATAWTQAATLRRGLGGAAAGVLLFRVGGEVHALTVLTGGRLADGSLNDSTYLGTVNADGLVTEWHTAPDSIVPQGRYLQAVLGAHRLNSHLALDGVIYQIGGIDSAGNVLTDVLGIGITTSGSYTLWTPLAVLPVPRAGAAGAAAFGTLYLIGGFGPDSLASRSVLTAKVDSGGTLSGWFSGPPLPDGLAFAAAVVLGHTLYVIGGEHGLVDPDSVTDTTTVSSTVLAIQLSPKTGAFLDTAWTVLPTPLTHPRARHAAFVMDGALVVTGGVYAGMPSAAETEYAVVDSTGALAAFQDLPPPTVADLAGTPAWLSAGPPVWDAAGEARPALAGGFTPGGVTNRVWSRQGAAGR